MRTSRTTRGPCSGHALSQPEAASSQAPGWGKPKWFGHGLSLPPDTELRRQPPGAAEQVVGQGATRPTYLGLAQQRQRAGIRTPTGFEFGNNLGPESSHGHLLRGEGGGGCWSSFIRLILGPSRQQTMLRTTGLDRRPEVMDRI